jgi:hypothetical protein
MQDTGHSVAKARELLQKVERRMQLLEEPAGIGGVYKSDRWLAKVWYSLVVQQEVLVLRFEHRTEELPGLITTCGQIEILNSERTLVAKPEGPYLLRLSDGRAWRFRVTEGVLASGFAGRQMRWYENSIIDIRVPIGTVV